MADLDLYIQQAADLSLRPGAREELGGGAGASHLDLYATVFVPPAPSYPAWVTHYWSGNDLPASGDPVNNWLDQIASVTLAQSDPTQRPVVAVDGGGFKHAFFDGVDDFLEVLMSNSAQPVTIFVVGAAATFDSVYRYMIDMHSTSALGQRLALYDRSPQGLTSWAGVTERTLGTQGLNKRFIFGASFDGASTRTRRSGAADVVGSAGANSFRGVRVGQRYVSAGAWHGKVYGIVLGLGHNASAAEMDELVAFLSAEHGAPEL